MYRIGQKIVWYGNIKQYSQLHVEGAKALYDVSEDEIQAIRQFVPEWSKTLH